MQQAHYVFSQVMAHLPLTTFRRCVARYRGEHKIKRFSCLDQYLCLAFAQLTWRESLRDIEACLRAQSSKLYHLGFRGTIARNTLANANAVRDWRIYADFAQHLIGIARRLYADDPLALELDDTVYALDSTTIYASRCSHGRRSAPARLPSSSIRCSICRDPGLRSGPRPSPHPPSRTPIQLWIAGTSLKAVGFPSARLEYRAPTWKANIDRGPWDRGARQRY